MFASLQKRLSSALTKVRGLSRISEKEIDAVLGEVRTGLLEADVHFRVAKDFLARVRERCLREEVIASLSPEQQIVRVLSEELTTILGGGSRELNLKVAPPAVILMCGLQGSGKTTSSVKLALYLTKSQGKRPCVVSVDVHRPAAMQQLSDLALKHNIAVLASQASEKPKDIAARALQQAREQNFDVLIVDSAGRLQVDEDLMRELQEVKNAVQPTETLLVVDSMMGQQSVEVAEGFERAVSLSGAVLSKIDGDARGGAALSLVAVTGKPIKFIGTGERASDFEVFHPDRIASRLLDMGDLLSLLEKAERVISQDEAQAASEKLKSSDFSLEDFRQQLGMISRMGSIGGLLKMLPGVGALREQLEQVDTEKELKVVNSILDSMTAQERKNPDVLNASRRTRIAKGCGRTVTDVNQLIKRFLDARKAMKSMGKLAGMMKNMGGGGGMPPGALPPGLGRRPGRGFGRKF